MADTKTGTEIAAQYGIGEALLNAYPELRKVYELFKAENTGAALEELYKTNYYKNSSATVKLREKQKLEQPAVYADELSKYRLNARKRLVSSGIRIDTSTFDSITADAYAKNLSEDQVDQAILTSGKITGFGGTILGDTNNLKLFASAYGVDNLLNDTYWNQKSKELFAGTITDTDIQEEIKKLSASAYPAYSKDIMLGKSLDSLNSNVVQTISSFLELSPEQAKRHPVYKQIMSYKDPTTNQFTAMPQWLVERTVKSTNDWGKTKNGIATLDSLYTTVAKDHGII